MHTNALTRKEPTRVSLVLMLRSLLRSLTMCIVRSVLDLMLLSMVLRCELTSDPVSSSQKRAERGGPDPDQSGG